MKKLALIIVSLLLVCMMFAACTPAPTNDSTGTTTSNGSTETTSSVTTQTTSSGTTQTTSSGTTTTTSSVATQTSSTGTTNPPTSVDASAIEKFANVNWGAITLTTSNQTLAAPVTVGIYTIPAGAKVKSSAKNCADTGFAGAYAVSVQLSKDDVGFSAKSIQFTVASAGKLTVICNRGSTTPGDGLLGVRLISSANTDVATLDIPNDGNAVFARTFTITTAGTYAIGAGAASSLNVYGLCFIAD